MISTKACASAFSHLSRYPATRSASVLTAFPLSPPESNKQKNNQTMTVRTLVAPAVRRFKKKPTAHPTIDMAKSMATEYYQMDNNTLIAIAHNDNSTGARSEVLKRHIMAVDNVEYSEAEKTFTKIAAKNREGMMLAATPYLVGVSSGFVAALLSIPLVFHLDTAHWFNEHYVTTEVPEPEDLETWLEVGSWTWNWMEPPLGQISFFLLCLQFSRSQMVNLGIRPFTRKFLQIRANRLSQAFPQYDRDIIALFSESDPIFPSMKLKW